MRNGATWKKLTPEQLKLIGEPSDELTTLRTEVIQLNYTLNCFDTAVRKRFEQIELEKLAIYEMVRDSRKCEAAARASLAKLVELLNQLYREVGDSLTTARDLPGMRSLDVMEYLHQRLGYLLTELE